MRAKDHPSQDDPGGAPWRRLTLAIAVGAVLLTALVVAGIFAAAAHIDAASKAREERLVANGLQLRAEEVRRSLTPNDVWDDAVAHLDLKYDPKWARSFIGEDLTHIDGYERIYVLDAAGRPLFAYRRGVVVGAADFAPFAAAAAPLLAHIRAAERARGPIRAGDKAALDAIDASTFLRSQGRVYVLAASLVQPDHTSGAVPSALAPVVVVGEAVDSAFVGRMRRRYLLDDLRLLPPAGPTPRGYASAPLEGAGGGAVARLAWRPNSPSAHLLVIVGPPLAAAFLLLAAAAMLLIRHERRRSAALVEATAAARQASDAKSAFLATISHEIRTPLNGVLGMAQAMELSPLPGPQKERLAIIRQSGATLLAVLNDVLDLSKIEAGMVVLESIDFDLEALARAAKAAFSGVAAEKGLTLDLAVEPAARGAYRGDPVRVRQVIDNLLGNAVKFTQSGGVTMRVGATKTGVRIAVADSGIGMEPDRAPRLFEKFVQADSSTTRRFGGSGLGLAISQQLVQAMGGAIAVDSALGVGSTFTVDLPLAAAAAPLAATGLVSEAAGAQSPASSRPFLRVLAAEDNEVNRLVLKALLAQVGVEPTIVSNGVEALAAFAEGPWDLILMDVQMPVMDGVEATRSIRALEAASGAARTRVIALTANAMTHQLDDYLAAGMDGTLAKPIEIRRLFEVIAAVGETPRQAAAA